MSKFRLVGALAVGIAISSYAPQSGAVKVERDSAAPGTAMKAAPAASEDKPQPPPDLPKLTAAQIADKNAQARGGLKAWRTVTSMTLSGRLDAGGQKSTQLPFTLQVKRPNKQHLAVEFAGETALQVFDGENGWTYRPYLGHTEAEPFSAEELRKSIEMPELDGPLIDYAAKGSKLELDGTETVEGKGDYRLKLTTKGGVVRHIWIDGTTFLETKMEGDARRFDGKMRPVETYLRDYRSVDGLKIPYVSETRVLGVRPPQSHKMTIEKVALNPKLDDALFTKPVPPPLPPGAFGSVPALSRQTSGLAPGAAPEAPTKSN